jgi:hypothetical protein
MRFQPTNSTIVPAARGSGYPEQGNQGAPLPDSRGDGLGTTPETGVWD